MSAHVFLTGATGFLGGRIARRLSETGARVHALCRPSADRRGLADLELVWHDGDLVAGDSVARALHRVRVEAGSGPLDIVHCAALISYRTRDRERAAAINVGGTRSVMQAALEVGVRRFLHVSSVVTVGVAHGGETLDEESAYNAAGLGVDYVRTKRRAEELVLAASERLDCVVVNPGAIFGKTTENSNSAFFLQRLAAGEARVAPPGCVAVVGVADTADGCLLALERGGRGRRYLLTESNLEHIELMRLVAQICGVRAPLRRLPPLLWRLVAAGAGIVDRVRPLERLTPQSMRMLGSCFRFDAARARQELGWRPRPFAEVLRETLAALGLLAAG